MNIYLASSWRNKLQADVLAVLRGDGHEVYDFKNPEPGNPGNGGFSWRQIGDRFGQCKLCGEQDPLNKPLACPVRVSEAMRAPIPNTNAIYGKFAHTKDDGTFGTTPAADVMLPHVWEGGWDAAYFSTTVLDHAVAKKGFDFDMDALEASSACVLVEPCGRSAHLELGHAVGQGKLTVVYFPELDEPELMIRMCDYVVTTMDDLRKVLLPGRPPPRWQRDVEAYDAKARADGADVFQVMKSPVAEQFRAQIWKDTYARVGEEIGPCRPFTHRECKACGGCWRHGSCDCAPQAAR